MAIGGRERVWKAGMASGYGKRGCRRDCENEKVMRWGRHFEHLYYERLLT